MGRVRELIHQLVTFSHGGRRWLSGLRHPGPEPLTCTPIGTHHTCSPSLNLDRAHPSVFPSRLTTGPRRKEGAGKRCCFHEAHVARPHPSPSLFFSTLLAQAFSWLFQSAPDQTLSMGLREHLLAALLAQEKMNPSGKQVHESPFLSPNEVTRRERRLWDRTGHAPFAQHTDTPPNQHREQHTSAGSAKKSHQKLGRHASPPGAPTAPISTD